MHANTENLKGIAHTVNELYTCLYGAMEEKHAPFNENPACFSDEVRTQGQIIADINYTLGLICSKLGM